MTSSTNDKCKCNCSTKSKFDALKEIDDLIKSCEFMTKYQYPATPINILKFKYIAQQAYFISYYPKLEVNTTATGVFSAKYMSKTAKDC